MIIQNQRMAPASLPQAVEDLAHAGVADIFESQHLDATAQRHDVLYQQFLRLLTGLGGNLFRPTAIEVGNGNDAHHGAGGACHQQHAYAEFGHAFACRRQGVGAFHGECSDFSQVGHCLQGRAVDAQASRELLLRARVARADRHVMKTQGCVVLAHSYWSRDSGCIPSLGCRERRARR